MSLGSRKNKLSILRVEVPGREDAKRPEYMDIPSFRKAGGQDTSASEI
jgi:hypothetical protein